jgi:hypothetical protein
MRHSLLEPLLVIPIFGILYGLLHPLFRGCTESVCMIAIAISWLVLVPFEPLRWGYAVATLLAGAFFGFRVMPAQTLAGLGIPPQIAADHAAFDRIAWRVRSGSFPEAALREMDMNQSIHLGTLRIYNASVFWAIAATWMQVSLCVLLPGLIVCVPIAMSAFPVGLVFKRWLARRRAVTL